jgi:hypothetical protein
MDVIAPSASGAFWPTLKPTEVGVPMLRLLMELGATSRDGRIELRTGFSDESYVCLQHVGGGVIGSVSCCDFELVSWSACRALDPPEPMAARAARSAAAGAAAAVSLKGLRAKRARGTYSCGLTVNLPL